MEKNQEKHPSLTIWSDLALERIKQKLAEITEQIDSVYSKSAFQTKFEDSRTQHKG